MVRISTSLKKLTILSTTNGNANIYTLRNGEVLLNPYRNLPTLGLTQAAEDFYELYLELPQPHLAEARV